MTSSKDEIGELLIGLTPYDYEGALSIEEVMTLNPELRKFKAALTTYIAREKKEAYDKGVSDYAIAHKETLEKMRKEGL